MGEMTFEGVVDFAIEREKEAVEFYREMQNRVELQGHKDMLRGFEDMEKGHVGVLVGMREKGPNIHPVDSETKDLQISNYLVSPEADKEMTPQDMLILAMKREEASRKLYASLAKAFAEEQARSAFAQLADEETRHRVKLETLYDNEFLKEN